MVLRLGQGNGVFPMSGYIRYVTAALPIWLLLVPASAMRANPIPNPGFEQGADGKAIAWTVDGQPVTAAGVRSRDHGTARWDSEQPHGGNRCLTLQSAGGENDHVLVVSPEVQVVGGYVYEVSFFYQASGLVPESGDRSRYAGCILDVFQHGSAGGRRQRLANTRILTFTNSAGWVRLSTRFTPPAATQTVQIRFALVNKYPHSSAQVRIDDVELMPLDADLPNPSFESGQGETPLGWSPLGGAKTAWAAGVAHSGRRSLAVSDAPMGSFSGWATVVPVRPDRGYRFGGWIKGGDLAAHGPVGGGVLVMEFFDGDGQPLGTPLVSSAVGAKSGWTRVATATCQPPAGAASARLTAGLQFCSGTAWFDELELAAEELACQAVARVRRAPKPSPSARYAKNLLVNGDVEAGEHGKPVGWTFVGRTEPDWSPQEIERFQANGRPDFSVGRAWGQWADNWTYAGKKALALVSVDPPRSAHQQWYGRTPVDGYWLSDRMPCQGGHAYLASAWIKPGAEIAEAWYGPLELRFYDSRGRQLRAVNGVRSGLNNVAPGQWSWWVTMPWVAPVGAATMRLRFGQELAADAGGWGRTAADNLAVWEMPEGTAIPAAEEIGLRSEAFRAWFCAAHRQLKPPYTPSPTDAPEYESLWGRCENTALGNLFYSPDTPVAIALTVANLLGEDREISLRLVRTDWQGIASEPIQRKAIALAGYGQTTVTAELPPSRGYGSFHLEVEAREADAVVGRFSGRYAVLPPLERPRTAAPLFAVTPLVPLVGDGRSFEREMGAMFRVAGFRRSWVRIQWDTHDAAKEAQAFADTRRVLLWYRALGILPVLQLSPDWARPIRFAHYVDAGKRLAREFGSLVAAYGNHGVEQANSASPFRGGSRERLLDEEYDTILAGLYDGIKAVDSRAPVLVGNIATDWQAKTVRRLYGKPAEGRFDGAILNAYLGILMTCQNNLKEFDAHGDRRKTIWQEETAEQRSPDVGASRRYGEAEGAGHMVRVWLSCVAGCGGRLKAFTQWGFAGNGDIFMVTENLQPRPQFVAHAVMADALADAEFAADRSHDDLSIFQWQRGDGPLWVAWANAGERTATLEVPSGKVTVMDLMGNRSSMDSKDGHLSLKLTTSPVYVFCGSDGLRCAPLHSRILP